MLLADRISLHSGAGPGPDAPTRCVDNRHLNCFHLLHLTLSSLSPSTLIHNGRRPSTRQVGPQDRQVSRPTTQQPSPVCVSARKGRISHSPPPILETPTSSPLISPPPSPTPCSSIRPHPPPRSSTPHRAQTPAQPPSRPRSLTPADPRFYPYHLPFSEDWSEKKELFGSSTMMMAGGGMFMRNPL
jgi:hypothetical protein